MIRAFLCRISNEWSVKYKHFYPLFTTYTHYITKNEGKAIQRGENGAYTFVSKQTNFFLTILPYIKKVYNLFGGLLN